MAKVVIAFASDPSRIGKTEDIADDEARVMVNEGRARYVQAARKTGSNPSKTKTADSSSEA